MEKPFFAIGDIHGKLDELDRVLGLVEENGGSDARLIFLGDYVDRGPDTRSVIDRLIACRDSKKECIFLKGNHDREFLRFMDLDESSKASDQEKIHWLSRWGGMNTLRSYGIDFEGKEWNSSIFSQCAKRIPKNHKEFLSHLRLTYETDDLFFVHAGVNPLFPLDKQKEDDLLCIREPFILSRMFFPKLIIHGHTRTKKGIIPEHHGNRVNIDTGCGKKHGRASVVMFDELGMINVLEDNGKNFPLLDPACALEYYIQEEL